MINIRLADYTETSNGVPYTIELYGRLEKKWQFYVKTSYLIETDAEVSMKIPFKLFNKVKTYLFDTSVEPDFTREWLDDQTLAFEYNKGRYIWPEPLVNIVKGKAYDESFTRSLSKCNHDGMKSIIAWADKEEYPSDLDWQMFPIKQMTTKMNDSFSIDVIAYTSIDHARWFPTIQLALSTKHLSRQSGTLSISPLDFIALRDYTTQFNPQKSTKLSLPSGKSTSTLIVNDKIKITIGEQTLEFTPDLFEFISQDEYIQTLVNVFKELNHELLPQSRFWFFEGNMFLDKTNKIC